MTASFLLYDRVMLNKKPVQFRKDPHHNIFAVDSQQYHNHYTCKPVCGFTQFYPADHRNFF